MIKRSIFFLVILLPLIQESRAQEIQRNDFYVESEPGISIFVREVITNNASTNAKTPILLIHGARVPGIASFDLDVPDGSLAEDLAKEGYPVYIMDARGYGYSTRPSAMSESPEGKKPLVRSTEAVQDIYAVVEKMRDCQSGDQVSLLGWATGSHWAAYFATLFPKQVSHLVFYNSLYGGSIEHPLIGHGSSLEDPAHTGRFNFKETGSYRVNTAGSLFGSWNRSIPTEDKTLWRDPDIAEAYAEAALASDATSGDRNPASFRAPSGAMEDSFYMATGRQLWDASFIRSAVLILRSELDFWSRTEDVEHLQEHLMHARRVQSIEIPEATHYVHLDRADRGRDRFIKEILTFLATK